MNEDEQLPLQRAVLRTTCPTCGQPYELPRSLAERLFPRSRLVGRLTEWFTRLTTRDLHE